MQSMTNFRWATAVDLNMGYYVMGLSDFSKKLCVISLPWGLYCCDTLPMVLLATKDIFQEAMGGLFVDLENVIIYIDDIIILRCEPLEEHLADVSEVLLRFKIKECKSIKENIFGRCQRLSIWAL